MFEDGSTETSLTTAMLRILQSFPPEDLPKITSDETFCNAIHSLNKTAKSTLPGLQAVAEFVRGPPKNFIGRVMTIKDEADVIDLTCRLSFKAKQR